MTVSAFKQDNQMDMMMETMGMCKMYMAICAVQLKKVSFSKA